MDNQRILQGISFFKIVRKDFGQNVFSHMKNFLYTTVQFAIKSKGFFCYEPFKKDPTNTIHNKVNNIIKLWKSKKYINGKIAYYLESGDLLPARFYGLPKTINPITPSDFFFFNAEATLI